MKKPYEGYVWVSLDTRMGEARVGNFRGRLPAETLDALVTGSLRVPFIKLSDTYFFDELPEEEDDEDWRNNFEKGTLCRYGEGKYDNFTGDIYLRFDTIINIAILKSGAERDEEY